jgi:hypothetical protein
MGNPITKNAEQKHANSDCDCTAVDASEESSLGENHISENRESEDGNNDAGESPSRAPSSPVDNEKTDPSNA